MFKKTRVAAIVILTSIILATTPGMLLAQGQIQITTAQQIVTLAEKAAQQVQNLIDMINADENSLTQIEIVGLNYEFDEKVTLFATGLGNLEAAQTALSNSEYENAMGFAMESLTVFREVYSSIHVILETANLQKGDLIENQGLLEAITRELQRIDRLRDILPEETPQEILDLLADAEGLLKEARMSLLDGDAAVARSAFIVAKQDISELYQYLKEQAEESNTWRLTNYCQGLQERIQERFRYGQDQGVDFTSLLQSFGYQTESQFMEVLQNRIQTAQNEQNINNALLDCEGISQMIQEMEQSLNQEIYKHQGQNGPGFGGSTSGSGGKGGGP